MGSITQATRWAGLVAWILSSAAAAGQSTAGSAQHTQVSYPGKNWGIELDTPGFAVQSDVMKPDGRRYFLAVNNPANITFSVYLEKTAGTATPRECENSLRRQAMADPEVAKKGIKYSKMGDLNVLEYVIPEFHGTPEHQKNFHACAAREEIYVNIHLTKAPFRSGDEDSLITLLKGIRFVNVIPTPATAPAALKPIRNDYSRESSSSYAPIIN